MKSLQELQPLIIEWAKDKNIHLPECAPKQKLKLIEECGELASAILKSNVELQKDAIGDIFVVLVILAEQLNSKLFFKSENNEVCNSETITTILQFITYVHSEPDVEILWLNDLANKLNLDLTECANIAWNEIKDRKGETKNGTFIKN